MLDPYKMTTISGQNLMMEYVKPSHERNRDQYDKDAVSGDFIRT